MSSTKRSRSIRRRSRLFATIGIAAATALALAGCSSGGTDSSPTASTGGKVELTYWSWATNIDQVVAIWNKSHPNIHVKVAHLAEGDGLVTKIITASKAGNLPDLMQVEYQSLPTLVSNDVVADLSGSLGYLKQDFPTNAWNQVTWSGKTYAVPGDVAPLMMYVRTDKFKELGLKVPTTWAEFEKEAAEVKAKDPDAAITSFDSTYPGWFAGLSSQAGAKWWSASNGKWKVNIDDSATQKVASYWSDMLSKGELNTSATYSADWNSAMAKGNLLSWIAPAWGAGVIQGIAPDTAGDWQAVSIPQWSAGSEVSGYWGGSATSISRTTKHAAQAQQFLKWLETSNQSLKALVDKSGLYPAATAGQEYATTTATPTILGEQKDFWQLAKKATKNAPSIRWAPNVNSTFSTMQDAFSTAITNKSPLQDTLSGVQSKSVKDLKSQGYPVAK